MSHTAGSHHDFADLDVTDLESVIWTSERSR